jgi:hypothetical protein
MLTCVTVDNITNEKKTFLLTKFSKKDNITTDKIIYHSFLRLEKQTLK